MADMHQCHRCELRFVTRSELEDHLAVDHASADEPSSQDEDDR